MQALARSTLPVLNVLGAVLALFSNLGRTACAVDPPKGDLLFETRTGASEDVRGGRLAGPATVAFLDPAR